jgi:hypothetical protein
MLWRVSTARRYAGGDMRHFRRISSPIALSRSRSVRLCYKNVRSVTSGPVGISAPPRTDKDQTHSHAGEAPTSAGRAEGRRARSSDAGNIASKPMLISYARVSTVD